MKVADTAGMLGGQTVELDRPKTGSICNISPLISLILSVKKMPCNASLNKARSCCRKVGWIGGTEHHARAVAISLRFAAPRRFLDQKPDHLATLGGEDGESLQQVVTSHFVAEIGKRQGHHESFSTAAIPSITLDLFACGPVTAGPAILCIAGANASFWTGAVARNLGNGALADRRELGAGPFEPLRCP